MTGLRLQKPTVSWTDLAQPDGCAAPHAASTAPFKGTQTGAAPSHNDHGSATDIPKAWSSPTESDLPPRGNPIGPEGRREGKRQAVDNHPTALPGRSQDDHIDSQPSTTPSSNPASAGPASDQRGRSTEPPSPAPVPAEVEVWRWWPAWPNILKFCCFGIALVTCIGAMVGELNGGSADLPRQAQAGKVSLNMKRSAPIELIESAFGDALDRLQQHHTPAFDAVLTQLTHSTDLFKGCSPACDLLQFDVAKQLAGAIVHAQTEIQWAQAPRLISIGCRSAQGCSACLHNASHSCPAILASTQEANDSLKAEHEAVSASLFRKFFLPHSEEKKQRRRDIEDTSLPTLSASQANISSACKEAASEKSRTDTLSRDLVEHNDSVNAMLAELELTRAAPSEEAGMGGSLDNSPSYDGMAGPSPPPAGQHGASESCRTDRAQEILQVQGPRLVSTLLDAIDKWKGGQAWQAQVHEP